MNHKRFYNVKKMNEALRRLAVALLLFAALPAWAVDYVISYTTGGTTYYLARNGTSGVQRVTDFDPATCIWSCSSNTGGTTASTLATNGNRYLFQTVNGTRYFLNYNLGLRATTANNDCRVRWDNSNRVYFYSNTRYIVLSNQTPGTSTSNTNVATAYPVGVNNVAQAVTGTLSTPTITPSAAQTLEYGDDVNYTASATGPTKITPAHTTYGVTDTKTVYYYNNQSYNSSDDFAINNPEINYSWELTGAGASALSLSPSTGSSTTVTYTSGASGTTATLTVTATAANQSRNASVTINITPVEPTAIASDDVSVYVGNSGTVTYTLTPGYAYDRVAATSGNTGVFTVTTPATGGNVVITPVAAGTATLTLTALNSNGSNGPSTSVTVTVRDVCAAPEFAFSQSGSTVTATLTSATAGATIRYTTNGTDPTTTTGTVYSGPFTVTDGQTIKAIAYKDGPWDPSQVSSKVVRPIDYITPGTDGTTVTLNDLEDHSWSYYSDPDCPIRSLNPADVKITYYGDGIVMTGNADYTASTASSGYVVPGNANYGGGAKVNVGGEDENTFVYYKTLERGDATQTAWTFSSGSQSSAASRCPYTPIYNPFQVRPTYGSRGSTDANDFTGWRGFQCWRLKRVSGGAVYSAASGGSALSVGAVINAETEIYFAPNSEYGMEVDFEAVWARAYLIKGNQSGDNAILSQNVGVERNFMTLTAGTNFQYNGANGSRRITNVGYPVTISCYYPSGEAPDNTSSSVGGASNQNLTLGADVKFENVGFYSLASYTLTANGHNLIVGRGCSGGSTVNHVRGMEGASSDALDYTIRLESGTYTYFYLVRGSTSSSSSQVVYSGNVSAKAVLGSDYDRAKEDNGKLSIAPSSGNIYGGAAMQISASTNRNNITFDWTVKSGTFHNGILGNASGGDQSIYLGSSQAGNGGNLQYIGKRRIVVEGGNMAGIAGAMNNVSTNYGVNDGTWAVMMRIKNGTIRSSVYGAAAFAQAVGDRVMVITGGTINGWVAGGCNGTTTGSGGTLNGDTKIYVGGNSQVVNTNADPQIGTSTGGNIFGAGSGYSADYEIGEVNNSNIVVADNATISKNVFGGGNYGYVGSGYASNIYIAGGTVNGNVFGGANQRFGQTVNVTVKGGNVKGGVYGGSNVNGTINNNVTMNISGGLIEQGAFGGGYGTNSNSCNVNGTVNITMTGGTILSGLYGGGNVNSTVSSVTMHVDGGQVGTTTQSANIHGGGFGQATRVSRNVELTLGSGCNATDGVTVYGDVYGGSALGYVNGTEATNTYHTYVTLYKGTIYGGLYGGGLGNSTVAANVYGPVQVKVYGGSVRPNDGTGENGSGGVFGCNNVNGTPAGTVTVDLYGTDPAEAGQEFALYAVYGGGNRSDYTGTPVVTIHGCDNNIEYVYGGGNASDVAGTNVTIYGGHIGNAFGGGNGFSTTGNHTNASAAHYNPGANITSGGTLLKIYGGQIDAAFGGSNQYGRIDGGITVNVEDSVESGTDPCSGTAYTACTNNTIEELYGGGNQAPAQTSGGAFITPSVTISSCDMEITNLFGGAKNANHGANINLEITKGNFQNVFGGNNLGGTITGNVTLTLKGGTMINAFGGNNQGGSITGTITVTVDSTGTECPLKVENVYGGGNMAAYEPTDNTITSPVVNVVNGTVRNAVFGGGLGSAAGVTANPQVTIGGTGSKHAIVGGRLIDDSDDGAGNVYGGGSEAEVVKTNDNNGNTHVILTGNAHVKGNVYGGGNQADVQGNTKVEMR